MKQIYRIFTSKLSKLFIFKNQPIYFHNANCHIVCYNLLFPLRGTHDRNLIQRKFLILKQITFLQYFKVSSFILYKSFISLFSRLSESNNSNNSHFISRDTTCWFLANWFQWNLSYLSRVQLFITLCKYISSFFSMG